MSTLSTCTSRHSIKRERKRWVEHCPQLLNIFYHVFVFEDISQIWQDELVSQPVNKLLLFTKARILLGCLLEQTLQVHGISLLQILLPPHYIQAPARVKFPRGARHWSRGQTSPRYYWMNKDPVALGSSCNKMFYDLVLKRWNHICGSFLLIFCIICYRLVPLSSFMFCKAKTATDANKWA